MSIDDWDMNCKQCGGMHVTSAHDYVVERRTKFAAIDPTGSNNEDFGRQFYWHVWQLIDLILNCNGEHRCARCGKLGPDCQSYTTTEMIDNQLMNVTHYCAID